MKKTILVTAVYLLPLLAISQNPKLDSLKKLVNNSGSDTTTIRLYLKIGREWEKGNLDSSVYFYKKAHRLAKEKGYKKYEAKALTNIGFIHYSNKSQTKLFQCLQQALQIYRDIEYEKGEMNTLYNLGYFYGMVENYTQAKAYFLKALPIAKKLNHRERLSSIYNNLGLMYQYLGMYDKSNIYQFKSLRLLEESGNKNTGFVHLNISLNYIQQENWSKAIEHNQKAIKTFRSAGQEAFLAHALKNLGDIYSEKKQLDSARGFYDESFEIYSKKGDKKSMARYYMLMGVIEQKQGNFQLAEKEYQKALASVPKKRSTKLQFAIYSNFVDLIFMRLDQNDLDQRKELERARAYAQKMLSMSNQLQSLSKQTDSYEKLYKVYKKLGSQSEALTFADKYILFKDSLVSIEKQKAIAEVQTKYETEKKEQQIAFLDEKQKLHKAAADRNLWFAIMAGGTSAIVLVLLLVIANSRKKIRTRNKLIDERNEELTLMNERLQELGEFKQEMTSMLVHDLKNPLNAIMNMAKIEISPNAVSHIDYSAHRMLTLVNNVLDTQKLEQANMNLSDTEFSAHNAFENSKSHLNILAREKSISIHNKIDPGISIKSDESIVIRIFENLLSNAIKYTPVNGSISGNASITPNSFVKISITDSGTGIPGDQVEKVFDKYYQVDAKNQGIKRATGIGLTFCKLAVTAMGGEIGVYNNKEKGCTFWFTVPLATNAEKSQISSPNIEHSNIKPVKLTGKEKLMLKGALLELQNTELYEISKIKRILQPYENHGSESIKAWSRAVINASVQFNAVQYKELTNL